MKDLSEMRDLTPEELLTIRGGGLATSPLGIRGHRPLIRGISNEAPFQGSRRLFETDLVSESNPQPSP